MAMVVAFQVNQDGNGLFFNMNQIEDVLPLEDSYYLLLCNFA